ncbi:hypothetical protein GTP45_20745 [Pseudoduganella sp. FT55W]|uniref:Uncharacterized protein n=1 Tax=Duganella rivi TaxID=2666083 RepID=A0A7X4KDD3_9BURK|nr:hypothetical protein [Duganella rivi]MYM69249.1 hypothetical protein [Duganella rivi]
MTAAAAQLPHLLTDDFFTDAPLLPLAITRSRGVAVMRPANAGTKQRYFCGGNEPPMLYRPPGPLNWDE